jgi:hypothetical protein
VGSRLTRSQVRSMESGPHPAHGGVLLVWCPSTYRRGDDWGATSFELAAAFSSTASKTFMLRVLAQCILMLWTLLLRVARVRLRQ